MPASATTMIATGLTIFASTADCPTSSAPMIDTVWPMEFGSRRPASCSSSKAMSMNRMIAGTENGTCCFA